MAKKYYWLRLQKDFFKRHDIRIIESMPNGKDYILFYLKLLVESVSHEGELRFSETIPYNEEMLATITNTNVDIVRAAMKVFQELSMIEVLEDSTIFMTEVDKMIGSATDDEKREQWRIRQQRHRDKIRLENVTMRDSHVTSSLELEKEKELKKEIDKEYSDDPVLNEKLKDFIKMRKAIKKPMTDNAIKLLIGKLEKLSNGDNATAVKILDQSIMGSWTGIYPLKEEKEVKPNKSKDFMRRDYDMDELERMLING